MKIFLAAIAIMIAMPAAAQTTPPADPAHAGHDMAGHEGKCCEDEKDGKKMHCCDKAKADGGKMACCDKTNAGTTDPHAGHDMSKK